MSKDLNSTTSALIAANLADEILKQYGMAIGLNSTSASKLTNMSMTNILVSNSSSDNKSGMMSMESMPMNQQTDAMAFHNLSKNATIIDQTNYQTATMLASSLKNSFLHDLQNAKLTNSTGLMRLPMEIKFTAVDDLGEGINNLISALNRNGPLDEIMSIVHGQIHPNVHMAFDLKLRGE